VFHEGAVGYILSDVQRRDIFRELYILKITEVTECGGGVHVEEHVFQNGI
jgi:hypothetical protein